LQKVRAIPSDYEAVRFRGKGGALQRAAARRLGRKGEDHMKTCMYTLRNVPFGLLYYGFWQFAVYRARREAAGGAPAGEPLSFGEWRALKAICK
jgi:hypothetical protein